MIRNYFVIALRRLRKHQLYSIINIAGLSIGFTCCMLLGLYIRHELSYDDFHEKAERISLFTQWEDGAGSGGGFAEIIKTEIAQIESVARIIPARSLVGPRGNVNYEDNFCFADSTIFNILTFQVSEGNAATALAANYSVLLSRRMADKYFPNENPMGKTILFNNKYDLTITGIFENLPLTSHLNVDFLCNSVHASELLNENLGSYWDGRSLTYVLFSSGNVNDHILERLSLIAKKTQDPGAGIWKLSLIPLRSIYLHAQLNDGKVKAVKAIHDVYIFSAIALFILILACFNYINLSTAKSALRGREVGVRKALGADRAGLMVQFFGESGIYIMLAVFISGIATAVALPSFNSIAGTDLRIASIDSRTILLFIGGLIVLMLLTGGYPSFVLSAFKPQAVLKGDIVATRSKGYFRKILVVGQFTVSVIMIAATIVVMWQLHFIQNKDLGYQTDQILTLSFPDAIGMEQRWLLKNELASMHTIESVSLCNSLPGKGAAREKLVDNYIPEEMKGQGSGIDHVQADADFIATFDIALQEGRDFASATPGNLVFLVNESAVKYFGWDRAEGKELGYYTYQYSSETGYREVPVTGEVIGVIKDYHQADLKNKIQPMMISFNTKWLSNMAIKIEAGKISEGLSVVEEQWKKLFPDVPFDYQFLDDSFDQSYKKEARVARIIGIFAVLAITVSCLGLFGLSSFSTQQKNREIGIRKVFGASSSNITLMLSYDYIRLVLVANVIAVPVAWAMMERWLQVFSYHIELNVWIFLTAGILSVVVAVLTVSGQALRAAGANPVESLKGQ